MKAGLDERTRILVVEDVATMRESYVANLELQRRYRVAAAEDLASAQEALDNCTYHVALVDIMLAGPKDVANRDGTEVLKHIRDLHEGTQAIVLSAQDEKQLVRDLLKDYGAFDYLDKAVVQEAGISLVMSTVESAAERSTVGNAPPWKSVVDCLTVGRSEAEFVGEVMEQLKFKGGFENLSRTLINVAKELMPLLPPLSGPRGLSFDIDLRAYRGRYWSKGQGCCVEVFLADQRTPVSDIEHVASTSGGNVLLTREKGQITVIVVEDTGANRRDFATRSTEPNPDNAS
jgi:CheY-like chemotaxis protein